jgi:hypothetical protein
MLLRTEPGVSTDSETTWDQLIVEIYPGHGGHGGHDGQKIVHQDRHHTGIIRVEETQDALSMTTENILGTPIIRLIGEPKTCFLDGKRSDV